MLQPAFGDSAIGFSDLLHNLELRILLPPGPLAEWENVAVLRISGLGLGGKGLGFRILEIAYEGKTRRGLNCP